MAVVRLKTPVDPKTLAKIERLKAAPPPRRGGRDRGTEELQRRRSKLAPADPNKASYALGVLLDRGVIDQDLHNAGVLYARLYAFFTGRYREVGVEPSTEGLTVDEKHAEVIEGRYRSAARLLDGQRARCKQAVDRVAVFGEVPGWVAKPRLGRADFRELAALLVGLEILAIALIGRPSRGRPP